jgi:hypothetical protein
MRNTVSLDLRGGMTIVRQFWAAKETKDVEAEIGRIPTGRRSLATT